MTWIRAHWKMLFAAIGAAATAISTAAVPDNWKVIASVIGGVITTLLVLQSPANVPPA